MTKKGRIRHSLDGRKRIVNEIRRNADIIEIAQKLGLTFDKNNQPVVLCPFHDDHKPSLRLYEGDKPHFYCFACNAHGNIYNLICQVRQCSFNEAVEWLAAERRIKLPSAQPKKEKWLDGKTIGLSLAREIYQDLCKNEDISESLRIFAKSRGFEIAFLHEAGVYYVKGNTLENIFDDDDVEQYNCLEQAGLLYKKYIPLEKKERYYDFFKDDRVVFALNDHLGNLVGFAGRVTSDDPNIPKYLYTKGFSRGTTLYRLDKVKREIERYFSKRNTEKEPFHLYVVEGLFDALRLESLGMNAVAALGNHLTDSQMYLIKEIAERIDSLEGQLAIHLFFDTDEPGQYGTWKGLPQLFQQFKGMRHCIIDIIFPGKMDDGTSKKDPDSLLNNHPISVQEYLKKWCYSPMEFWVSYRLNCHPDEISNVFKTIPYWRKISISRDIERIIIRIAGQSIREINLFLDSADLFESTYTVNQDRLEIEWISFFHQRLYLPRQKDNIRIISRKNDISFLPTSTRLSLAMRIADSSSQRREIPVDEASWDRLKLTDDITKQWLLDLVDNEKSRFIEPFTAVRIPRLDGDYRLKALPCPEDLILQQFMLNNLLSPDLFNLSFIEQIPAVRYYSNGLIFTTGLEEFRPANDETVRFAYQINMDALEGKTDLGRDGMFRPFTKCWENFITFIEKRILRSSSDKFFVTRLDVRRYYDQLPRFAVNNVLQPCLKRALEDIHLFYPMEFKKACEEGTLFPKKFSIHENPELMATTLCNWFCDQSFNFTYYDPETGNHKNSGHLDYGIPQGPDLSAYLANIALFPLDHALSLYVSKLNESFSEKHGNDDISAIYARYVDDIVIVSRTSEERDIMRAKVEKQLEMINLELNKKPTPTNSLSKEGVQNWLRNRRGGMGVSGQLRNTVIGTNTLLDAGDIDRSDSLSILHSQTLSSFELDGNSIIQSVRRALCAEELRFSDYIAAARLLWYAVYSKIKEESQQITEDDLIRNIADTWNASIIDDQLQICSPDETPNEKFSNNNKDGVVALLDGLGRLLNRNQRKLGNLSNKESKISNFQKEISNLIWQGLCEKLYSSSTSLPMPYEVKLKIMTIYCSAGKYIDSPNEDCLNRIFQTFPRYNRLFLSLAESVASFSVVDNAHYSGSEKSEEFGQYNSMMLFHESISRLQIHQRNIKLKKNTNKDPLTPIQQKVFSAYKISPSFLNTVLLAWIPDNDPPSEPESIDSSIVLKAITGMVNLVDDFPDLINKRSLIKKCLCDKNQYVLHQPAGVGIPGFVLIKQNGKNMNIIRYDIDKKNQTSQNVSSIFFPDLNWKKETKKDNLPCFTISKTTMNNVFIRDYKKTITEKEKLELLPKTFKHLAKIANNQSVSAQCPPTYYNLLYDPSNDIKETISVLGYGISEDNLGARAFRRYGSGLISEPIPSQCANLWRIGTALADWFGYIGRSRELEAITLGETSQLATPQDSVKEILNSLFSFTFYHLRGFAHAWESDQLISLDENGLPYAISRILGGLEKIGTVFSNTENSNQNNSLEDKLLPLVLPIFIEGRALRVWIHNQHFLITKGGASYLSAAIAQNAFRGDENWGKFLPQHGIQPDIESDYIPKRRASMAWYAIARRFDVLVEKSTTHVNSHYNSCLRSIVAGLYIQAIGQELRAKALESWVELTNTQKESILKTAEEVKTFLWDLDEMVLLTLDQETDDRHFSCHPVKALFRLIYLTTSDLPKNSWNSLEKVTPLGWLVAWAVINNFLPGAKQARGLLNQLGEHGETINGCLIDLARALSRGSNPNSSDPPWDELSTVTEHFCKKSNIDKYFKTFNLVDNLLGIKVFPYQESEWFVIYPKKHNTKYNVKIETLSHELFSWQVTTSYLYRDPSDTTEYCGITNESERIFRWSEVRNEDNKILSIGVISQNLAFLAGFLVSDNKIANTNNEENKIITKDNNNVHKDNNVALYYGSDKNDNDTFEKGENQGTSKNENSAEGDLTDNKKNHSSSIKKVKEQSDFHVVEVARIESWKNRSRLKSPNIARIALLQFAVDDSYRHPKFEICKSSLQENENDHKTAYHKSCAEYRRQRILEPVLRACNAFDVDILLLPEYSVRPETVHWLSEHSLQIASRTSIWAGTFRKPPLTEDTSLNDVLDWGAVLPVIISDDEREHRIRFTRQKRYPSVALGEKFNPSKNGLTPIYNGRSMEFDPKNYVIELICSETFIATGLSNLHSIASAYAELNREFGETPSTQEGSLKDVLDDVQAFSNLTSYCGKSYPRRSIILVPAFTSRPIDFAAFGQSAYLSAGLTTVVCNAVCGRNGKGQSCFVGYDGWDKYNNKIPGMPEIGPYHGVTPGFYRPWDDDNHGLLGEEEEALLIADIDPINTSEGKPRPQLLPRPMKIVAHLPLIYKQVKKNEFNTHYLYSNRKQCPHELYDSNSSYSNLCEKIIDVMAILNKESHSSTMHIQQQSFNAFIEILIQLCKAGGKENLKWLKKRLDAFVDRHLASPQPILPPVITDWIEIDLSLFMEKTSSDNNSNTSDFPKIEVPKFSFAPGEQFPAFL